MASNIELIVDALPATHYMAKSSVLETTTKMKKKVVKKVGINERIAPSAALIHQREKKEVHPQVQRLLQIPKIEQKTPEWYEARHNLITASDFAQALGKGKFGTQRQLIMKKVEQNTDTNAKGNIFFDWGNLFEPVACMVYGNITTTTVHEFGLIKHSLYDYFGASPDGITDEGVMLEIKCPLRRKIEVGGDVPEQYYYQIQGQLDVCNLDECDYFECEFVKFDEYADFVVEYQQHTEETWCGVFSPRKIDDESTNAQTAYECTQCQKHMVEKQAIGCAYWILTKYNLKRVQRDKVFLTEKLKQLGEVWQRIVYYRAHLDVYQMEMKKTIQISTQVVKTIHNEEDTAQHMEMSKPVTLSGYRLVKIDD